MVIRPSSFPVQMPWWFRHPLERKRSQRRWAGVARGRVVESLIVTISNRVRAHPSDIDSPALHVTGNTTSWPETVDLAAHPPPRVPFGYCSNCGKGTSGSTTGGFCAQGGQPRRINVGLLRAAVLGPWRPGFAIRAMPNASMPVHRVCGRSLARDRCQRGNADSREGDATR